MMTLKEEIKLLEKKVKLLKEVAELETMIGAKPEEPCYPTGWKLVPYTPPYSTGDPLPPDPIITVTNNGDLLPSESITVTEDFKTISAN